ncbi:ABZJ_00895 family protein [Roseibium sediminicola]|uniref:ABZJ_00895 family protein n=1 Tax=Roseibium sediminicola TaxID=2933272 RepID=UPI0020039432
MQKSVGLIRFALVFTGYMIAMGIVSLALEYFTGVSLSGTVNQIVSVMGAATDAGQRFYKTYEVVPDAGFAWSASFQMTLVEIAISVVLGGLFIWALVSEGELANGVGPLLTFLVPLMIFMFAISWVLKRYMFVSGARRAEKVQLKKQEKSRAVFE